MPIENESKKKRGGGPTSPDGKQRSSKNSLIHGGCTKRHVIMPGESPEAFDQLMTEWIERYHPMTASDLTLVTLAVQDLWRLERSSRNLSLLEFDLYTDQKNQALWSPEDLKKFETFRRYRTADANAFQKQLKLIEHLNACERQADKHRDKLVDEEMKALALPDKVRIAQEVLREMVYKNPVIPTERPDGGCRCIACAWAWGLQEYARIDALEEQRHEP